MTSEDEPIDPDGVKSSLRRLAGPDEGRIIERASAALDDVEAAATFVEEIGLAELEAAIEATDDPDLAARGRRALDAFRRFRRAAAGGEPGDHFHPGHGTPLRTDPEGPNQ
ncbi:hypothetical protein KM295_03680 [Natronomonas sp. F2-12]|uniref:Uncharacterized protein n=1 Tax=Natronomonas aquatica TaxID=2841590 RepID=A0A9R1CPI4_9EURY|nr:hypothetical protein [Natronomonas aquatica]